MGTRDLVNLAVDGAAIEWARSRAPAGDARLITDAPWSRTYRFGGDEDAA